MKVGFTGTRYGMTDNQKNKLKKLLIQLKEQGAIEFHHGDCIGADTEAHIIAKDLGYRIIVHPPLINKYRGYNLGTVNLPPKHYLQRNRDIVDSTDILIAVPKSKNNIIRSGTWYTIRYALKNNKPVEIIYP